MNCVNQSIAQMINNTHGVNVIEICKYLNEDKLNEFFHIIKSEMNHNIIDEISKNIKNNENEHFIQSGLDIIHEMEDSNNIDNLIILSKYFSIWYKNSKEIKIKKSENDEIINSKQEEIKNSENTNDEIQQSENNEECVQMYFDFKTIEQFKTFIKNTGVKDVTVKKHLNNLHKWSIFMNNKLLVNQDLFVDILKNKDTTLSQKLSLTTTASKILQFMNLPNQNILDYMRQINLKLEKYYKNNKDSDNTGSLSDCDNSVSDNSETDNIVSDYSDSIVSDSESKDCDNSETDHIESYYSDNCETKDSDNCETIDSDNCETKSIDDEFKSIDDDHDIKIIIINDIEYLKDHDNNIYIADTHELIGKWNSISNSIHYFNNLTKDSDNCETMDSDNCESDNKQIEDSYIKDNKYYCPCGSILTILKTNDNILRHNNTRKHKLFISGEQPKKVMNSGLTYYKLHREKVLKRQKEYNIKNKDKIKIYNAEYNKKIRKGVLQCQNNIMKF